MCASAEFPLHWLPSGVAFRYTEHCIRSDFVGNVGAGGEIERVFEEPGVLHPV